MSKIQTNEAALIEEFSFFEDEIERYEYIIELGQGLEPLEEIYKSEAFEVKGCQSKVWLRVYDDNKMLKVQADSNTQITKGLIAILIRSIEGADRKDILSYNFEIIDKINLRAHLTSQRSNGLNAMIQTIKFLADGTNSKG